MKKILLVCGSSFCADIESVPHYALKDDWVKENMLMEKWASTLSSKLNYELINKSKISASNLYIFDQLMENIIRYEDRIGLVVASWSYAFKTSIFREYELNFVNLEDQDCYAENYLIEPAKAIKKKVLDDEKITSSIDQTLRFIIYLQDACDKRNIKCIHYPLLNVFKTGFEKSKHIEVLQNVKEKEDFKKISSFENTIGWPCDTLLGGYTYNTKYSNHIISNQNHHPNENGHNLIANEIYDKYLQITNEKGIKV